MKTAIYISALLAIVLVSCKKVELEPNTPSSSPSPVFHASVTVDGNSNPIAVGETTSLTSYHEMVGVGSYFGTSFIDDLGNDLLSFEFGLLTPLTSTSLSSTVDFGSLNCNYELDANNLQTNVPFSTYVWDVDGTTYINTNAPITEFGAHDITFYALLADGSEVMLKDRVVVGGLEMDEPEILIAEVAPNEYTFSDANTPSTVDSIQWEINVGNSAIVVSSDSFFYITLPFPLEHFTVTLSYYENGNLVNYSSIMHASPLFPAAPYVDMNNAIANIESAAIPLSPHGKATYNYNGELYSTKDNTVANFSMSNMNMFVDEYTLDTYLKGSLQFESYLYNTSGDSIYVEVSSEIGFSDVPN
jgi:hypothetical protein